MNYREYLKEKNEIARPMLICRQGIYQPLQTEVTSETEEFTVVSTEHPAGNRAYERSLCFLLARSLYELDPKARLVIEHSISKGLYCEILGEGNDRAIIQRLEERMAELVRQERPILRHLLNQEEAMKIFQDQGQEELVALFKTVPMDELEVYEIDGYFGYYYGPLAANSRDLDLFALKPYEEGFILRYPSLDHPHGVPPFKPSPNLYEIFRETGEWHSILGITTIADLNKAIEEGKGRDLVAVAEALHEKKYAMIADAILARKTVRVVLMAGPSSAGKTTSSKRLAVQLRVNGLEPYTLEMDNYFVNRHETPLGEDGKPDFEALTAVDLERFNRDVKDLLAGKTVTPTIFDFTDGLSKPGEKSLTIPENGIILIEGIHALNPSLLDNIPREAKFKIYISALTQLNMDFHNRISTTDVRKLRRSLRDFQHRGWSAEETLQLFHGVIAGEKKNIFPYQEEADAMFNSTLVYELAILKKHVAPLLAEISPQSPSYDEARRLLTILHFIHDLPDEVVPSNSILREFIGGSFFQ